MIIQCEQCRTKFKLGDEKVSERGVKVRCAKCKHVFTVRKEQPVATQASDDTLLAPVAVETAAGSFESGDATARITSDFLQKGAEPSFAPEPDVAFDFGTTPQPAAEDAAGTVSFDKNEAPASGFDFDFGMAAQPAAEKASSTVSFDKNEAPSSEFDFGDLAFANEAAPVSEPVADFGDMTVVMPPKKEPEPLSDFGLDFGVVSPEPAAQRPETAASTFTDNTAFDFGDVALPGATSEPPGRIDLDFGTASTAATSAGSADDFDISSFDFGSSSGSVPAAVQTATEKPEPGSFDFGDAITDATGRSDTSDIDTIDFGSFIASPSEPGASGNTGFSPDAAAPSKPESADAGFDISSIEFGDAQTTAVATPDKPAVTSGKEADSFTLGEIDFTSGASAVTVNAENSSATAGFTNISLAKDSAGKKEDADKPEPENAKSSAADITFEPPSSQGGEAPPLSITSRRIQSSPLSILIGVVTIAVVGILGYIAYSFINDGPKAVSLFGKGNVSAEDGKIVIQNVKAHYIADASAGELLVITGEALNSYKKPRAALQVKGTVFGAANEQLAVKTAFAGNQLTDRQLATMPSDKIEAAMNNQFGDSLVNLEVQPGKNIPFTIVFINPPKNGKDYGVESTGSTVAATKNNQ